MDPLRNGDIPDPPHGRKERLYTISELCAEANVSTRTLRFYEDEGLLEPVRAGVQRLYPQKQRTRLKLILRGKRLGFALAEIREIIDMYDRKPGEAGQLRHLIARLAQHREQLLQKRRDIEATLGDLEIVEAGCLARLKELDTE